MTRFFVYWWIGLWVWTIIIALVFSIDVFAEPSTASVAEYNGVERIGYRFGYSATWPIIIGIVAAPVALTMAAIFNRRR